MQDKNEKMRGSEDGEDFSIKVRCHYPKAET